MDNATFAQLVLDTFQGSLKDNDDYKYELVYGCLKLFAEIDINGDESMDWKEFMQYIVDAVSSNQFKGDERHHHGREDGRGVMDEDTVQD